MTPIPALNDGSQDSPKLKIYLTLGTLAKLPDWSIWNRTVHENMYERLAEDGFAGVQGGKPDEAKAAGLEVAGGGRINNPEDAITVAEKGAEDGFACTTVHAGTGLEDDSTIDEIVSATVEASAKTGHPIYIETHRATIAQDIWRTVKLTERNPEIRFNGDFSHFYTGQEMVYGDWDAKMRFLESVFDRVRFLHGRIGSPGCMQVDIGNGKHVPQILGADFVAHFREMWTRSMRGFLATAKPGDFLVFSPEILFAEIYYARVFPDAEGQLREESDRYQQALLYAGIAKECFEAAKQPAPTLAK